MKISEYDIYLDGGTIMVYTDEGIFCFDDRLQSTTKGRLYHGYPLDDNSNLIGDSEELERKIIEGLVEYNDEFYSESIKKLINSRK